MLSRASLVLLSAAAGACFSDAPPGGLSTASGASTADASTADATTAVATTSSTSTTTGDASTLQPTSAASTTTPASATDATATASTGHASDATTDATTATTPMTGPPGTTTGLDFSPCVPTTDKYACYTCCSEATPDWSFFLITIQLCVCAAMNNPCQIQCANTLCEFGVIDEACFDCIAPMVGGDCFSAADMACKDDASCAPYYDCLAVADCGSKPN